MNHSTNGVKPPADKLPPHNVEAEEALVGAILIDSRDVFPQIATLNLSGRDFFTTRLGWIFEAASAIDRAGSPVDLVTLRNALERQNRLSEVGGISYITELINATPTATHGPHYAKIVNETAYRRRRIEAATRAVQLLYDEQTDLDSIETQIEEIWQDSRAGYASPQSNWQLFTLADAYQTRKPLEYAIDGLFALPSLNIVYGSPGTMKSLLIADMLTCVAAGREWLPPLPGQNVKPRHTEQSPGFWLDFDNGLRLTHERFEALGRALTLPETTPVHYVSMPNPWLDSSDFSHIEALAGLVDRLGVKMIVIDNLGTVSGGLMRIVRK